jgi:hypothetical protein
LASAKVPLAETLTVSEPTKPESVPVVTLAVVLPS